MSPSPTPPTADRNLLFGVLALQLGFLGRDALIAGMNAWAADKARPLGRILCDQGAISAARLALLEALVDEHVAAHGGDPAASLAAVAPGPTPSAPDLADLAARSTLSPLAAAAPADPPG